MAGTGAVPRPRGDLGRYLLGVTITVAAILSQYVVPERWPSTIALYGNLPGDLFVVYGIPIIAFAVLVGRGPLLHWASRLRTAALEGLRWYGLLSLLALAVTIALGIVYEVLDPSALRLLERENPALAQAAGNPWFWVGFSFVIGAFEETIFRGWIYGFWEGRTAAWIGPAIATSVLFAGVHLYYGTTYGAAAPLIFPSLFFLGLAFAATYHYSGGNLVVVAVLHGAYDAASFVSLINTPVADVLHYALILVGALVALLLYLRSTAELSGPPAAPA